MAYHYVLYFTTLVFAVQAIPLQDVPLPFPPPYNGGRSLVIQGAASPDLIHKFASGLRSLLAPAGLSNPLSVSNLIAKRIGDSPPEPVDEEENEYPHSPEYPLEQPDPAQELESLPESEPESSHVDKEPVPKAKIHTVSDRFFTHSEEHKVLFKK